MGSAEEHHVDEASLLPPSGGGKIRVSRARFWAVALFALVSAMQNVLWICFSVIQATTQRFYGLENADPINLLVGLGAAIFCPFVLLSTFLLDRIGLRATVVLGTLLLGVGSAVRLLSVPGRAWGWVVAGQVLNGIAGPVVMGAPSHLSNAFFPPRERTMATAVAWLAQPFGLALGFILGPAVVQRPDDLPTLLWAEAGVGVALFLCVLLTFPRTPRHAPSRSALQERASMSSLPKLGGGLCLQHSSFVALTLAWGVSGGVFTAWQTLLDLFLHTELGLFTAEQVGWLGFAINCSGGFGAVCFGSLVDRWGVSLKKSVLVLFAASTAGLAALICVLQFTPMPQDFPAPVSHSPAPSPNGNNMELALRQILPADAVELAPSMASPSPTACSAPPQLLLWVALLICIVTGAASTAVGAVVMEWAVDLTFPLSEAVSAGIMTFTFNAFVALFAFLGDIFTGWTISYITLGVLAISTITLFFVRDETRRKLVDEEEEGQQQEAVAPHTRAGRD